MSSAIILYGFADDFVLVCDRENEIILSPHNVISSKWISLSRDMQSIQHDSIYVWSSTLTCNQNKIHILINLTHMGEASSNVENYLMNFSKISSRFLSLLNLHHK